MSAERLTLHLQVAFPDFELDVSQDLELKAVTAVFGHSGGGKSTLLRAIAGFQKPRAGRIALGEQIWFDSRAGLDLPAHRRPVGFVFQDSRLFRHLDVAGNLAYADKRSPQRHDADGQDMPSRKGFELEDIVAALDLRPLLKRRISSLSGGESQRVALGRTLLARPRLLLLDEPISALDRERKAEILPYLEQLPRRFGIPSLYVSHSMDEVARLAESVMVLAEGRVQAYGEAESIFERIGLQPLGRFEAGTLVEGHVAGHDTRLSLTRVEVDGEVLVMPMIERLSAGQRIRLRIRARDVALATARPEGISIRNVLPATVSDITPQPGTAFVEVLVDLKGARIRSRLTRSAVEDLRLAKGTPVYALIKSVSFDRRLL